MTCEYLAKLAKHITFHAYVYSLTNFNTACTKWKANTQHKAKTNILNRMYCTSKLFQHKFSFQLYSLYECVHFYKQQWLPCGVLWAVNGAAPLMDRLPRQIQCDNMHKSYFPKNLSFFFTILAMNSIPGTCKYEGNYLNIVFTATQYSEQWLLLLSTDDH